MRPYTCRSAVVAVLVAASCEPLAPSTFADGGTGVLLRVLSDDGSDGDQLGHAVDMSGAIVIVGARGDADNGPKSGSAYLFSSLNGSQLKKLLPDDVAANDLFGHSIAIEGTLALVGVPQDDDNGANSGTVRAFDTIQGLQLSTLRPNDGAANDQFGWSVALSGSLAVVGARQDDDNGSNSGSAYVFDVPSNQQLLKLLPVDGAPGDWFGNSVASSGGVAVIGSFLDDDNGDGSGSAYVFDIVTGQQLHKLVPEDGAANDQFGWAVAVSGNRALVGAYLDDDNGDASGAAYIFDVTTGQQLHKLLPLDGAAGDWFGYSVDISGSLALIGARNSDGNGFDSGSAYLFEVTTGRQIRKLMPNDGAEDDQFGSSVAINGNLAVVGAHGDDDNGFQSGSAYLVDPPIRPAITMSPRSALVGPEPTTVVFEVAADSLSPATYQWRRDDVPLIDEDGIFGAASPTLTVFATEDDIGIYDCEVANKYGSVVSDEAVLGFRTVCTGDLTGDGMIDVFDLFELLANWGPVQ